MRTGDTIRIDFIKGRCDMLVADAEIERHKGDGIPPVPADAPPPILVATDAALAAAAARWSAAPVLSLDTEFVRERTFFQKLGLVQVGDGAEVWLVRVDSLAADDWDLFRSQRLTHRW